jgi:type II secretory pathway pseudopilin PulG
VEIIIATAIFTTVVAGILVLFNSVLQINRRVQATRQLAQASRNFTEALSREVRNGRIDYSDDEVNCNTSYDEEGYTARRSLAITSYNGEKLCFYVDLSNNMVLKRITNAGTITENINPDNVDVDYGITSFQVRPTFDPYTIAGSSIQPMVTVLVHFTVNKGTEFEKTLYYQSSISTDIYDIQPDTTP